MRSLQSLVTQIWWKILRSLMLCKDFWVEIRKRRAQRYLCRRPFISRAFRHINIRAIQAPVSKPLSLVRQMRDLVRMEDEAVWKCSKPPQSTKRFRTICSFWRAALLTLPVAASTQWVTEFGAAVGTFIALVSIQNSNVHVKLSIDKSSNLLLLIKIFTDFSADITDFYP